MGARRPRSPLASLLGHECRTPLADLLGHTPGSRGGDGGTGKSVWGSMAERKRKDSIIDFGRNRRPKKTCASAPHREPFDIVWPPSPGSSFTRYSGAAPRGSQAS